MFKFFFPFGLVRSFDPITAIGVGTGLLGAFRSLLGGGGSNIDINGLLEQLRTNIRRIGGAGLRQQEAITRQNVAGSSRLQSQAVLGRQQERGLGQITEAIGDAEARALQMLLGAQFQQNQMNFARQQQLLGNLANLGSALGGLTQKTPGLGGQQITPDIQQLLVNLISSQSPAMDLQQLINQPIQPLKPKGLQ